MDFHTMLNRLSESENWKVLIRQMFKSLMESENFEPLTTELLQIVPSAGRDQYWELTCLLKSLFGEKEVEQLSRQMDICCILSCVFGTEEYVNLRRELVNLRDKIFNRIDASLQFISSGSLGEGVAFPQSDDDILIFPRKSRVVQAFEYATHTNFLLMVPLKHSPGYCLLLDFGGSCDTRVISIINEVPFCSSTLFKDICSSLVLKGTHIHGPCLLSPSRSVDTDYAICIRCSTWPSAAKEWIERDRYYGWPSPEIIRDIEQSGCHVVPIGDPYSNNREHEWRISFSIAERRLVHLFNHAQFLTYNLLRFALKMVIDKQFPDVLCSYFMKTTLFHTIERTPRQMWREDNLEICFIVCLSVLYNFIDYKICPNYFIPKYNMIKRKVDDTNKQQLLDLIRCLIKEGISGLLLPSLIPKKSWFWKFMEKKLDIEFLQSYYVKATIRSCDIIFPSHGNDSYTSEISSLLRISQGIETQNEFIYIILHIGILRQCQISLNRLWGSAKQNKQSYLLYKTIQTLLQRLIHRGDVSTGKLTVATCMFLVGKTRLALLVIQKLLSKYPSYAIENSEDWFITGLTHPMCLKGCTIEKKAIHAWTPHFPLFYFGLDEFPLQLKMLLLIKDVHCFHPLTYALVLENFCHLQLHDISSLIKSTSKLLNHLDNLKDDADIAVAKFLIGIIKLVQGDSQSAYMWFGSVYMTKEKLYPSLKENLSEAALMCIVFLIYQERFLPKSNWKMVTIVPTNFDLD